MNASLTDGQWAALEQIASLGQVWLVPSKPNARTITHRMAARLAQSGLVENTGTKATLTDAGLEALKVHRGETGRYPA